MPEPVGDLFRDLAQYGNLLWRRAIEPRLAAGRDDPGPAQMQRSRALIEQLHPRRMRLEVVSVVEETGSTKTFGLARLDGPLPLFRPGQFVNLFVTVKGTRTSRPYSISSAPGAATLDLTVREDRSGFVSPWLCRTLALGDVVEATGPQGTFCHEPLIHGRRLVFVAGGSGITPFLSMLRDKEQRRLDDLEVLLLYGSRRPDDVIFGPELERLSRELPGFRWRSVISEPPEGHDGPRGLIDAELLRQEVGDVAGKTFYLCGPRALHALVTAGLSSLGVPRHRIRQESFGPPRDVWQEPGWPAGLSPTQVFTVDVEGVGPIEAVAGEPLISSLERQGIVLPARCRAGQCAACQTRVLSGAVYMLPDASVRESDQLRRVVHACVTYPIGDLTIRVPLSR